MYYCYGITEKGIMPHNEDALLIGRRVFDSGFSEQVLEAPFIAAVADGVSNADAGEIASRLSLEKVKNVAMGNEDALRESLLEFHREIAEYTRKKSESSDMQATLCGISVDCNENILSFNVGDSRLYLFRNGTLCQISKDQSFVQMLYDEGNITKEEKKTHARRNIIFPVFGNTRFEPTVDIVPIENGIGYGDIVLICTDGLSDYVSLLDMQEILELPKSLQKRLEMLVKKSLENGCKDNISVVAIIYTSN